MDFETYIKNAMIDASNSLLAAMLSVILNRTLNREEALRSFREAWQALGLDMELNAARAIDHCLGELAERMAATRPADERVH